MKVIDTAKAKEDIDYWRKKDIAKFERIELLLAAIKINPFKGLGKPEPQRFEKTGYWSRRIDHEHRLVYKIHEDCIYIAQCRYHYKK